MRHETCRNHVLSTREDYQSIVAKIGLEALHSVHFACGIILTTHRPYSSSRFSSNMADPILQRLDAVANALQRLAPNVVAAPPGLSPIGPAEGMGC